MRVIGGGALLHKIFRYGKTHALAQETGKVLELQFCVTNSYAPQRFMSSSYLILKRLEASNEAYIKAFKDHNNDEEMQYKLCGNDFVFDFCGPLLS